MEPIVQTMQGSLRGRTEAGVAAFRGIRYAEPPVGPLRFAPPVPVAKWHGVRDASEFGPTAPQHRLPGVFHELFGPTTPAGDDCLSLNVWSPDPAARGLPVLVWIHGGGFSIGSGCYPLYDGATFARDGVVCVTINYRLGAAGFLYLEGRGRRLGSGDPNRRRAALVGDVPGSGNFGLLDQIAALRWVQENVAAFGGDPGRVTIAGESAGGGCVAALLGAPAARGLFRRAIVQSGGVPRLSSAEAALVTSELHRLGGIAPGDVEALRALSSARLVELQAMLNEELLATRDPVRFGAEPATSTLPFQPVSSTDVLPQPPLAAIASGSAAGVDLLVGTTEHEFRLFLCAEPVDVPREALAPAFEGAFPGRGERALAIYSGARPEASPVELIAALETDRMFRIPSIRLADVHSARHPATWFYRLSWRTPAFGGRIGAAHGIDLPLMWQTTDHPLGRRLLGDSPPRALADDMHRAWVAFITSGDPGHGGLPDWPRYDAANRRVLDFGERHRVLSDPDGEERALWDGIR